jgi:hypothetical protein
MHPVIYHRVRIVIHAWEPDETHRALDTRLVVLDLQREDGAPYEHHVRRFARNDMQAVRKFIADCRRDDTIVHLQEY